MCGGGQSGFCAASPWDGRYLRALASTPPAYWRRTFLLDIVQLTFNFFDWLHGGRGLAIAPPVCNRAAAVKDANASHRYILGVVG